MLWTVEGLDEVVKPERQKAPVDQPAEEGAAEASDSKLLEKTPKGIKRKKKKKKVVIDKLTPEELEEF
eukprot:COSAG02_NODE_30186_length_555_cov_8.750765_1_plen_67_part_01